MLNNTAAAAAMAAPDVRLLNFVDTFICRNSWTGNT